MLTAEQTTAVVRRYRATVEPEGDGLRDLDSGAVYQPRDLRDALGWIAAGMANDDGSDTRLGRWWHAHN